MTKIPKNYKPTKKERFMNSKMKEYFRLKLINWKKELLKESSQTINKLQKEENSAKPDLTDRLRSAPPKQGGSIFLEFFSSFREFKDSR